jgi:hypothetical protein
MKQLFTTMKEDSLKKVIKAMYLIREVLKQKQEDDKAFSFKPKSKVLTEVDDIIDRSLEEFYSLRGEAQVNVQF